MQMGQPMDRTRILYTNLKNNRASAQFLTQINPKVVNIVNIPHKGNAAGTGVQSLVNKTIQRVVVSSSQPQNQQLATAFRQSPNVNANSTQGGNTLLGTNAAGNTLIITTSSASDGSSIIFNDMNTTSTIANSINTNNSNQTINLGNLTSEKMNHNDGNATTINRWGNLATYFIRISIRRIKHTNTHNKKGTSTTTKQIYTWYILTILDI